MRAGWDYWQTETLKGATPAESDYLYLYLISEPNKLKLEMFVYGIPTERGESRSLKAATGDAIRRYRELTGDYTTRFVIKSDRRINRRINKLRKQYLAE